MKGIILLLAGLLLSACNYAQQPDTAVLLIPTTVTHSAQAMGQWLKANAANDYDAIKSLYYWIGNNVSYDVKLANSTQTYKDTADAAAQTLATRSGICQGYTCLFFEVCRHANIPIDLITGYTYIQGQLSLEGSHGWMGAKLNGKWGIIDPTWGAGAVDQDTFVRSFNWAHFMIPPEKAIYTHVPFDPIFQYLPHPLKPAELRDHSWHTAKERPAIYFEDSIAAYKQQTALAQVKSRMRRMETYGVINQLQRNEMAFLRQSLPAAAYSTDVASGNDAEFRTLIDRYNKLVAKLRDQPPAAGEVLLNWVNACYKESGEIYNAASRIRLEWDVSGKARQDFLKRVQITLEKQESFRKTLTEYLQKKK